MDRESEGLARDEQNAKLDPDRIEKQNNYGIGKNIDEFSGCFNEYNWWQNQFVTKDACAFQWKKTGVSATTRRRTETRANWGIPSGRS